MLLSVCQLCVIATLGISPELFCCPNTGLYDLRFTKVYTNVPDIDNVPGYLCETGVYPNGFPEGLGGNECFVITMRPGADITAQLAFGFYNDKIAIRHRIQLDWSNWRYFNPSS